MSDALIQRIIADAPRSDSLRLLQSRVRATHFLRSGWLQSWSATAKAERSIGLITWLRYFLVDRDAWAAHCTLGSVLKEKETLRGFLNEKYTRSVLYSQAEFFDSVEANPLTERQRAACASDEDATLVLAGAGTGKTSTILAKIGLLLRTGQCQPEEILAISFTNKSTKELADRVRKRLGVDVPISTFHKLGLGILAKATGAKPLVAPFAADPIEKAKHLDAIFDALKSDQSFLENLVEFCAYYRFEAEQLWNFGSLSEYATWLQSNRIVSLDGISKKVIPRVRDSQLAHLEWGRI
jgi:DNA helicase IV